MRTSLLVLSALVSVLSGCTASYAVRLDQLATLDGFDANSEKSRVVETVTKEKVAFTANNLALQLPHRTVTGDFTSLSVRDGLLLGTLRGAPDVSLALTDLRQVRLTAFSPGSTAKLVLALVVGVAAAIGVGVGIAAGVTYFQQHPIHFDISFGGFGLAAP